MIQNQIQTQQDQRTKMHDAPFASLVRDPDEQPVTANSFQHTKRAYAAGDDGGAQNSELTAASSVTSTAPTEPCDDDDTSAGLLQSRETKLGNQRMIDLLRRPVFELTEFTYGGYFDNLANVILLHPDLVKQVREIRIVKNPKADYSKNVYDYESVIGELIEFSSLRRLTLQGFDAREIISILATLKPQTGLECLNLENNSLTEGYLSVIIRSLPPRDTKQPLTLQLNHNLFSDADLVALLVAGRENVKVLEVGTQRERTAANDQKQQNGMMTATAQASDKDDSSSSTFLDLNLLRKRLEFYRRPEIGVK